MNCILFTLKLYLLLDEFTIFYLIPVLFIFIICESVYNHSDCFKNRSVIQKSIFSAEVRVISMYSVDSQCRWVFIHQYRMKCKRPVHNTYANIRMKSFNAKHIAIPRVIEEYSVDRMPAEFFIDASIVNFNRGGNDR